MIYWTASNNSSFLNGLRSARSERAAVRDARRYVDGELYGDGKISYYSHAENEIPYRIDEKSIYTGHVWTSTQI